MLLGEYEHTIDDKNRLTLPAKFRQAFADGVVLTRGMEGCVIAYARRDWDALIERRIGPLDPLSREARTLQRFFFAGAADGELDKQGRIGVPPNLISHASLGREVVVAGLHDHLEIWDRAAWRAQLTEVEGSAEHVAERLAAQRN
ncbi:MAG: division/cell wall cluster transcriptional repressor MraZ [Gaiellaceae bacterium]